MKLLEDCRGFSRTLETCYAGYQCQPWRAALATKLALSVVSVAMNPAAANDWSETDTRRAWYGLQTLSLQTDVRLGALFASALTPYSSERCSASSEMAGFTYRSGCSSTVTKYWHAIRSRPLSFVPEHVCHQSQLSDQVSKSL